LGRSVSSRTFEALDDRDADESDSITDDFIDQPFLAGRVPPKLLWRPVEHLQAIASPSTHLTAELVDARRPGTLAFAATQSRTNQQDVDVALDIPITSSGRPEEHPGYGQRFPFR
jgi:hypothetical protein